MTQRLGPSQPRVCSMCCSIGLREPLDTQHYQLMSWLRARFWIKLSMRPATRSGRSPSFRFCSASLWIMERVRLNLPSASCSCRSISRRAWSARRTASPTWCAFADPVRIARPTVALVLPSSRPAFPSSQQPPRPSPACRKRPFAIDRGVRARPGGGAVSGVAVVAPGASQPGRAQKRGGCHSRPGRSDAKRGG